MNIKQEISTILERLTKTGAISMGAGYCVGMSDILKTSLAVIGIKSHLIECTVLIFDKQSETITTIGFDNISRIGQIDTHIVCITETQPMYLIDASISHALNGGIILESISSGVGLGKERTLLKIETEDKIITYTQKDSKVPMLLQESILNRIETDKKIFNDIKILKRLNIIGIILSLFAVVSVINQIIRWY